MTPLGREVTPLGREGTPLAGWPLQRVCRCLLAQFGGVHNTIAGLRTELLSAFSADLEAVSTGLRAELATLQGARASDRGDLSQLRESHAARLAALEQEAETLKVDQRDGVRPGPGRVASSVWAGAVRWEGAGARRLRRR